MMFAATTMLLSKPKSIGFIDGIIFSFAFKGSMGDKYSQFTTILTIFFVAFVVTLLFFQHRSRKIFWCIIPLTLLKWVVDYGIVTRLTESKPEFNVYGVVIFILGAFMTYIGLLVSPPKFVENSEATVT